MSSKESRQNWARLIQKIYEVDPLICPKCWGQMHIISFIEELDVIKKFCVILGFGISVTMIHHNLLLPTLSLIWFITFLTPKSRPAAGINSSALGDFG